MFDLILFVLGGSYGFVVDTTSPVTTTQRGLIEVPKIKKGEVQSLLLNEQALSRTVVRPGAFHS